MRALDLLAMASSRVHQARNTVKGFGTPTMLINMCAMVDSMYRTYLPRAEKTYVQGVGERGGVRGGAVGWQSGRGVWRMWWRRWMRGLEV
jgi:hypothetical protein